MTDRLYELIWTKRSRCNLLLRQQVLDKNRKRTCGLKSKPGPYRYSFSQYQNYSYIQRRVIIERDLEGSGRFLIETLSRNLPAGTAENEG
jgi:hypothetical protein